MGTVSRWAPVMAAAVLVVAGCAPAKGDATEIDTGLTDFRIELGSDAVPEGVVSLAIQNAGEVLHEVEVFAGAEVGVLPPISGSVADMSGLSLIDEVEDIVPGSRASLVVDLPPGTYLVICNLPEHYGLGMWAYLEVTPQEE